jgi:uncharacterized protein YciI
LDGASTNPGSTNVGYQERLHAMAQFIMLGRRNTRDFTEADFAPVLEAEAEQARVLYTAGTFRQIYGRKDKSGAIIVIEAGSAEEAHAAVATLPLVAKGMLDVELIEVGPYRGFAPRG